MYLIGILCLIKLYHSQHPDVSAGAIPIMFMIGLLLTFEAVSYYEPTKPFWIVFSLVYLCIILVISVQAYFLGSLNPKKPLVSARYFLGETRRVPEILKSIFQCKKTSLSVRFAYLAVVTVFNVGFFLYMLIVSQELGPPKDASNHILVMIIGNQLLYMGFYMVMKTIYKELLTFPTVFYFISSILLSAASIYFFMQKVKDSRESPGRSRQINKNCILFNFYDHHDVWHFLSATGLFTVFMFLLNINEDLKYIKRQMIPVF